MPVPADWPRCLLAAVPGACMCLIPVLTRADAAVLDALMADDVCHAMPVPVPVPNLCLCLCAWGVGTNTPLIISSQCG
jgi:hypothetical protein